MDDKPLASVNLNKVPILKVCAYCCKLYPEVDEQIKKRARVGDIRFNHGMCYNHAVQAFNQSGASEEQIKSSLSRFKPEDAAPDLRQHPELVKNYSQGIFTEQELNSNKQSTMESISRFRKLAGIN